MDSYKEVSSGDNAFKVNRYYHTQWLAEQDLHIKLDGLNMDKAYENLVKSVEGGVWREELSLGENLALLDKKEKLQKEIARLEKLARSEKQPKKKFEYVQMIKKLKAGE